MKINNAFGLSVPLSTDLTAHQLDSIKGLDKEQADRLTAQMKLQNLQEVVSFISNIMKKRHEIAMSVINNMR